MNQTALALAELVGDAVLVTNQEPTWPSGIERRWETASLHDLRGLALLIDIDGMLTGPTRTQAAAVTVVFLRTFLQFTELDASVYLETPYRPRSFAGVQEIWCWDVLNPPETLPSIQTLFPCPIRRVPFVWSPTVTEYQSTGRRFVYDAEKTWCVHVAEQNEDNTSSAVLPLVAMRELWLRGVSAKWEVHGLERVKDARFLEENVLNNIEWDKMGAQKRPMEPYATWVSYPNTAVLSHSRFVPMQIGVLNALWLGLPVVHNSPVLRGLHPQLEAWYYQGNHIGELCEAMGRVLSSRGGEDLRGVIRARWGVETVRPLWRDVWARVYASDVPSVPSVPLVPLVMPLVASSEVPSPASSPVSSALPSAKPSAKPSTKSSTVLRVAFSDMWPGFSYESNFLLDALRHHGISVRGFPASSHAHDVVVCGPYSTHWTSLPGPKIFFSAENWPLPSDDSIALYLTPSLEEDATHLRVPTWMTFIDWFSGSTSVPTNHDVNPIRFPVHFATTAHSVPFSARPEFCAFVVSNPVCALRNEVFHAVHAYKKVNSGGALFNNIGSQLSLKYAGGGCGDVSKYEFFSQHRFTLSFENSQAPGYVTEKLLHAKMAGCVPLYWGSSEGVRADEFNLNSFVDLSSLPSAEKAVEVIRMLEENPRVCEQMAAMPLLTEAAVQRAHHQMRRLCEAVVRVAEAKHVPPAALRGLKAAEKDLKPKAKGWDAIYVINLDTRPDRWAALMAAHPELEPRVTRVAGVKGTELVLTEELYRLFERNEFQWKKSVMGCNLSHREVWKRIAGLPVGSAALVLEDDVRFDSDWEARWGAYEAAIPADAEVLYLGGVLPPNRAALPLASSSVNSHWDKIVPNTFFSPSPVAVFHFCAYSYVLTQRGAAKLMAYLEQSERKFFTVSDHLLGHPEVGLVKYHARPLLTHCFQEADEKYVNSAFNELHRKDTFDSDIWNNTECMGEEELRPFLNESKAAKAEPTKAVAEPFKAEEEKVTEKTLYYMSHDGAPFDAYELEWLRELFGVPLRFVLLENVQIGHHSWFVVQRPYLHLFMDLFDRLQTAQIPFHVLHLSDEFGQDPLSFYSLSMCTSVLRNYVRTDIIMGPHVHVIPLGYHHRYKESKKSLSERELRWSFHGTDWFERSKQLAAWVSYVPYRCNLQPHWNHPTQTRAAVYLSQLGNSQFCPILKGQNAETFRFYEALEAGALPITTIDEETWLLWVEKEMGLSSLYPWREPEKVLATGVSTEVQKEVGQRWEAWKERVKEVIRRLL